MTAGSRAATARTRAGRPRPARASRASRGRRCRPLGALAARAAYRVARRCQVARLGLTLCPLDARFVYVEPIHVRCIRVSRLRAYELGTVLLVCLPCEGLHPGVVSPGGELSRV